MHNGISASLLPDARWQKSRASGALGNCVEMAGLPAGRIAVRNSRDPDGPALVYTKDDLATLIKGLRSGDFDNLVQ